MYSIDKMNESCLYQFTIHTVEKGELRSPLFSSFLSIVHCVLYTVYCILTLYTVRCILCTVRFML